MVTNRMSQLPYLGSELTPIIHNIATLVSASVALRTRPHQLIEQESVEQCIGQHLLEVFGQYGPVRATLLAELS